MKEVLDPAISEVVQCEREPQNAVDRYLVAIIKGGVVAEHYPRRISRLRLLFCDEDVPLKKFRVFHFHIFRGIRKYFYTENFRIYGIWFFVIGHSQQLTNNGPFAYICVISAYALGGGGGQGTVRIVLCI